MGHIYASPYLFTIRTSYPPRSPHHGWSQDLHGRFHALSPFALHQTFVLRLPPANFRASKTKVCIQATGETVRLQERWITDLPYPVGRLTKMSIPFSKICVIASIWNLSNPWKPKNLANFFKHSLHIAYNIIL
jgi:hypothetical protein